MIVPYTMDHPESETIACGIARRFMENGEHHPGYQTDLCLQGLLCLYDATGNDAFLDYVVMTLRRRGIHPFDSLNWRILFTDLHSEVWLRTRDDRYMDGWLPDLHALLRQLSRDDAGRITFFLEPERNRLLIDMLQGFSLRMGRAGLYTGDHTYFDYAAEQFRRYAQVLVHPRTGLWHHGRGWNPESPDSLAPAGWCRGQAWVLRGLVETMACMPETETAYHELHRLLIDLAGALLRYQGENGMWHQMIDEPQCSYPETSGSGMIVYYLGLAWQRGWLTGPTFHAVLSRAQSTLCRFVDEKFRVYNGCPHSPPKSDLLDYLVMPPAIDDRHAVAAMMMALSLSLAVAPPAAAPHADNPLIAIP